MIQKQDIQHDQMTFFLRIASLGKPAFETNQCVHYINRLNKKNHMIISIEAKKSTGQNSLFIYNKNSQQTRNRKEFSQLVKESLQKSCN